MNKVIIKISLMSILSLIVMFVGATALIKAISSDSMNRIILEVIGYYISLFAFSVSNSILKDYIREYK